MHDNAYYSLLCYYIYGLKALTRRQRIRKRTIRNGRFLY